MNKKDIYFNVFIMNQDNINEIVKAAICFCAEDGIVSETEEKALYGLISKKFPDYSQDNFNRAVDDFFSTDLQLEDYLSAITDPTLQKLTLEIGTESAASDGLDFRENVALEKARNFWNI